MKGAYVCIYISSTNAIEFGAGFKICPINASGRSAWMYISDIVKAPALVFGIHMALLKKEQSNKLSNVTILQGEAPFHRLQTPSLILITHQLQQGLCMLRIDSQY